MAGQYQGHTGFASHYLPLDYYDIHLDPDTSTVIDTDPDRSIMVFTLLGDASIGGERVKEKTAVKLSAGERVVIGASDHPAQVLFVSSKMLGEPVSWGGPIVMNTKEELNKAFDDLRKGTFIQKGISY